MHLLYKIRHFLLRCAAVIVKRLYVIYCSTVRLEVVNPQCAPKTLHPNHNVIYVAWHSKSFLPLVYCRNAGIATVVLPDWKNQLFGMICDRLGYKTVPFKDAATATIRLKDLLEKHCHVTLIADGPIGQSGVPKPGILRPGPAFLAAKTEKAIVVISVRVKKSIRVRGRWDKYEVPLPFTRATLTFSPLLFVGKRLSPVFDDELLKHLGDC